MKRRFLIASSGAALLAGCSSAPVHNWSIAALPGAVRGGAGQRVGVRPIGLPAALNQSGVPVYSVDYAANTFPNDQWAAPLSSLLQTAMVQNLAQRLPADTVLAVGGAIGAAPDELVEIQLLTFAPDSAGEVRLMAQLAVRPAKAQIWQFRNFSATAPAGKTAQQIVAAMSQLWAQAADQVAAILA